MKTYNNLDTECRVTDCRKIQFGEFDTCRMHTSHMKAEMPLLDFLDG